MKKILFAIAIIALMAAGASAEEQSTTAPGTNKAGTSFDADLGLGYRWITNSGSPLAGEYDWLHSSAAGKAVIEWDTLPDRFFLETHVLSSKEYFGDLDYAYGDIVMVNLLSRSLYHNTEHVDLGADDPATASPSNVDLSPGDQYGVQDMMNRAQIRLKTPDFPFHIYLEARNQEKKGTIQQTFFRSFSGGYNRATETRPIDYVTTETKATANSHLGPVEAEYSHSEKTFRDTQEIAMTDITTIAYIHNEVPKLESSNDTVKLHTSHTGRIAAAFTYSSGDKKNDYTSLKDTYKNAGADLTIIPHKDVTISVRYRRYEIDEENSTLPGLGTRDALSTTRDTVSAFLRYRATQDLTLRLEYLIESLTRDFLPGTWALDKDVTKNTVRLGGTYRFTSRFMLRGDLTHMTADVPANSVDNTYPEKSDSARGLLTWNPSAWFNVMLSGGTTREERSSTGMIAMDGTPMSNLGERKTERNNAMGTVTFLLTKTTSLTPGYSFYQNKSTGPIVYTQDVTFASITESGVPYADTVHVASLSLGQSISDVMMLTVDVSQSHSRGSWQNSGTVAGSTGIAELTNLKVVENEIGADLSMQYTRNLGTDFRYTYRDIDDKIDNTLDGTNQIMLATLTYKW
jgi:opacity protein-like surface antigen